MPRVPLPPRNAQRFSTVCQFCIVGCGYHVYKWPALEEGGPAPQDNALGLDFRRQQPAMGTWISPNQHSVVTDRDGSRHNVVIIPDQACHVNDGFRQYVGAALHKRYSRRTGRHALGSQRRYSTKAQDTSKTTWTDAVDLGGRIVKAVIDRWGPHAVGMKFFDHGGGGGGFENNWAVGRFFFSGVGTRTASIHNRPAYNSEVHAAGDAGLAALTNSYLDAELCDTILIVGANPYESQTNYYLAHMVPNMRGSTLDLKRSTFPGETVEAARIIIVDPRRTMTVATAEAARVPIMCCTCRLSPDPISHC